MPDLNPLTCPFCGGEMDERGGQCNYNKKTMMIDLKCRQCETIIKFKTKWQENPYKEAIERLIVVMGRRKHEQTN